MKLKTYFDTKICKWIFVTALFIIAKIWKQPRYPSVSEWINKLWYMWTMGYYSVLKRNELSSYEKTWRNLECILVRERRQSEKTTYHISPTVWHWVKSKIMETIKKSMLTWDGGGKWCISGTQDFYGSEAILHDIIVDTCHYTILLWTSKWCLKNNMFLKTFNM